MQGADESTLLQCPYDHSHRILKARFQVHLGRCRRNHKNVPKVTCPFNVTHVLNKPELDWHVSTCPERQSFENFKYRDDPTTMLSMPVPPLVVQKIESSEDWDDEPDVPSYDPSAYASNAPVLRNIQGAPPSVRKQFRKEERLRLLGIDK